jgi:predicted pyridoxine 5'-phosphate oxidase superfamily flavin-nucleotide-binding protein
MTDTYHDGELRVQERAGVRAMAERIGRGIYDRIPPAARGFLREQRWAVLGAADRDGRVWASPVSGEPGVLDAPDDLRVHVFTLPPAGDPLRSALAEGDEVGLIAIDLATRRRMRVNGTVGARADSGFDVWTSQVYSNCPKYISVREIVSTTAGANSAPAVDGDRLTPEQSALVEAADTFFVATLVPGRGADASHRGGPAGFVTVRDERTLSWPDFSGNTMFQTLGNIDADGRAGLLFVDFETGRTLQLSGRASIVWGDHPETDRAVEFRVDRVHDAPAGLPLRWRLRE